MDFEPIIREISVKNENDEKFILIEGANLPNPEQYKQLSIAFKDQLSGMEFNLYASNYERAFNSSTAKGTIVDNGNGEFLLKFLLKENQLFPDLNIDSFCIRRDDGW